MGHRDRYIGSLFRTSEPVSMIQEYFQTLTERYDEVISKCIALADLHKKHWPGLVNKCEDTVKRVGEQSRKNSEALTKIADFVTKITGAQLPKCVPPPLPKDKAEVIPFLKQYFCMWSSVSAIPGTSASFSTSACVHCPQYSYVPCASLPTTTQG